MEFLVEVVGELLLTLLQELWPPVLAIVNGVLVVCFALLTCLFFTTGQSGKAVCSLVIAAVFLVVLIVCGKAGVFARRTRTPKKNGRKK